jgi:ATP-dependent Clp protease adaptor protein ClpS
MTIRSPFTRPGVTQDEETQIEPRYRVIIHNDDVTTFDYVIHILNSLFMLSSEMAEHIAYITHNKGAAVVVVRPRSEAQKLCKVANDRARRDVYPLTFSSEPEDE